MTPLFDIDTVATYKCNQGFRFVEGVGDPVRRCVDRGAGELVFSGSAPQCARESRDTHTEGSLKKWRTLVMNASTSLSVGCTFCYK